MPCHDAYPTDRENRAAEKDRRRYVARLYIRALDVAIMPGLKAAVTEDLIDGKDNDYAAKLCALLRTNNSVKVALENTFRDSPKVDCELKEWWERHEEQDRREAAEFAAREERKERRRKVMEKLTPQDCEDLGIRYEDPLL
jgi:hypothetical protein